MKNNFVHILLAALLVGLLILLTDPFMLWMPPMMLIGVLCATVIALGLWTGFVMKEQAADEREALHRMHAGRVAYLSGMGVLTLALLAQGLAHDVDPWVAAALGVMVVAKLAARLYFEKHQ